MSTPSRRRRRGPARPGRDRTGPQPTDADQINADRINSVLVLLSHLDPNAVVYFEPVGGDEVDVGIRELPPDPRCGGAGLFGLEVPPAAELVGVTFHGRNRADDGAPVRVDVVVGADGTVASQVHEGPGDPVPLPGPSGGIVVDALHRVLGLPAPGEPPPLTALVAGMWLHKVLSLIRDGVVPTWADAADAHAGDVGRTARRGLSIPPSPEAVSAGLQRLADEACWEDLRRAAAIGRMTAPELDPWEAEWMDATLFARWMVDSFPPIDLALRRIRACGAVDTADRMGAALDHLRPGPWPSEPAP